MRDLVRLTALVFILACSSNKDSGGDKKPPEPVKDVGTGGAGSGGSGGSAGSDGSASGSADKPAETPRKALPKFDLAARFEEIGTSYNDSHTFATENGNAKAKERCEKLEPLFHPFCYEGIGSALFTKAGATGKTFEAAMAKFDTAYTSIDCQGLGFALEDSPKLAAVSKELTTEVCRGSMWDGQGFYRALAAHGAATASCRNEEGKAPDAKACEKAAATIAKADIANTSCGAAAKKRAAPAGMETSCSHGVGRALVFMFGGDPKSAVTACASKDAGLAASCLSGVGFVVTFLLPDRTDVAVDLLAGLPADQKAAFARGMARALAYWKQGNSKSLATWLEGSLSSSERKEAERLAEVHDKCTTYFDLDKCEWQPK